MAPRGDFGKGRGSGNSAGSGLLLLLLATLVSSVDVAGASQDAIPHLCDNVRCPPMSDIVCPPDSDVRDSLRTLAALLQPSTAAAVVATEEPADNHTLPEPSDELFAQCCLAKKCVCRTCFVPDCQGEADVVLELTPEAMDTPGRCCGSYECRAEPNCTEVRETTSYWLSNCQRCRCFAGERICHQSCDEGAGRKSTAICSSKTLNRFFEHGESWKAGCYECECVNGEEKCVLPFCRSVNCPQHRQVLLKDSCCPICWPANIAMPNAQDAEYDEEPLPEANPAAYDDADSEGVEPLPHAGEDYADNEVEPLPNVLLDLEQNPNSSSTTVSSSTSTTTSTTSTSTSTSSTTAAPPSPSTTSSTPSPSPAVSAPPTTSAPDSPPASSAPCLVDARHDGPATYQVYPEVVEVVRQTRQNDLLYALIGCLALAVVVLTAWNIHLRAKQRSYRPVSIFDDNFNKTSSNA